MSALNKKFQKFLIIDQLEKETTLGEILLIKKMKSLGLEHSSKKWISKSSIKENYQKKFTTLQLEEQLFPDRLESLGMDNNELIKVAIEQEYKTLKVRTHISMCNFYCIYLALKKRYPNFLEITTIEKEIKDWSRPKGINAPLVRLYAQAFSLLKTPSKRKFLSLHNNLYERIDQVHPDYIQFILSVLVNYCIKENNANDPSLKVKIYEYLKLLISFTENEIIPFYQIINLVTVGCQLKKYAEVSDILERHQSRIETSGYNYSKAMLHYKNDNFDTAIDLLSKTNFTNHNVNINARSLLIEIYIKNKAFQLSLSQIEALRVYVLRSKKILSSIKKRRLNYLRFLKAIILLKENKSTMTSAAYRKSKGNLHKKIQSCEHLIMRQALVDFLKQENE